MTNLSRRTLVASAAAMPALAVPAVAADNPDAELVKLGAQLEALECEWLTRLRTSRKHRLAYSEALEAAGLPNKDFSDFPGGLDEMIAYHAKQHAVWYEGKDEQEADEDEHGASKYWLRYEERAAPLLEAICALRPKTLAGLAIVTRATALHNFHWWDEIEPEATTYIEVVSAFLGIKTAPAIFDEEA